jgi:hypothetical protein
MQNLHDGFSLQCREEAATALSDFKNPSSPKALNSFAEQPDFAKLKMDLSAWSIFDKLMLSSTNHPRVRDSGLVTHTVSTSAIFDVMSIDTSIPMPPPKRFYRRFWRSITKRMLLMQNHC